MKTLVLAAGLGTRLKPFTFSRAKASLPLLNIPFLHYSLQYLYSQNESEIIINLHAHPDSVRLAAKQFPQPINIEFSHEPEILGTAGAIQKAFGEKTPEQILVMNSDMLTNIPLDEVKQQHFSSNADATLVVMNGDPFPGYGGLYFEEEDGMLRFNGVREGKGKKYHYTGIQVLKGGMVEHIPANQKSEMFSGLYLPLLEKKRILGFLYQDFWHEIGTLEQYWKTSIQLLQDRPPEHLCPPGTTDTLVSKTAIIESNADVSESIIMDGARIKSGVRVERSIIGWDVTVSKDTRDMAVAKAFLPWPIRAK